MEKLIFVINPGSTSSKFAIYSYNNNDKNLKELTEKTYFHTKEVLVEYKTIYSQKDFRKSLAIEFIKESGFEVDNIDIFVARGGLLKPIESGVYEINDEMIATLRDETYGSHASNLGAVIASDLASLKGCPKYIADPVVVDELSDLARVTGYKNMKRISIFHPLNTKEVARNYASKVGKDYKDLNLILCHLGGGISIALHNKGRIVDVNNALNGEGPFSPERAGTLPVFQIVDLCYSNKFTVQEIKKEFVGKGGLISLIGTNDGREISRRINEGDQEAKFYMEAMAYQIIKSVGALYFAAKGEIDAIIFTGGLVNNKNLISYINEQLPNNLVVEYYPGEHEMIALAKSAVRVQEGIEKVKIYF